MFIIQDFINSEIGIIDLNRNAENYFIIDDFIESINSSIKDDSDSELMV